MRKLDAQHSFLSIQDQYGNLIHQPILVVGSTGYGKGLCCSRIVEEYHRLGCVVIVLADPKHEVEYGYQMFEPEARYHKDYLRAVGIKPEKKKVKLYHPFTFNIPMKEYFPEYKFYTIPLSELGKNEWGLMAETHSESEAVSLLLKASSEITNEDGLIAFVQKIQQMIKGNVQNKKRVADWSNFGVQAGAGTMKELSKITGYLTPFKKHFFLSKNNTSHKLNWKEILNDQENYHIFGTHFLDRSKDDKTIGFIILYLLESILRNKNSLNRPLVIVIPEIKNLCPFKPDGYQKFLAFHFTKALSMIRSSGRGMTAVLDTQNWGGLDKDIKDIIKVTLLGQLSGNDLDEVGKKWIMPRDKREFLRHPPKPNSFTIAEEEYFSSYTFFMPSSMHCEPAYQFHEMCRKKGVPLKNYRDLIKEMRNTYKEEEDKWKKKIKKQEDEETLEEERERQKKESMKDVEEKVLEKVEKIKEKLSIIIR